MEKELAMHVNGPVWVGKHIASAGKTKLSQTLIITLTSENIEFNPYPLAEEWTLYKRALEGSIISVFLVASSK